MKRNRVIAVLIVVCVALLAVQPVVAFRQGKGRMGVGGPEMGPHGPRILKLMKQLDLTDTQKDQAKAILEKYRADLEDGFEAVSAKRHEVKEMILADTFDEAALRELHQEICSTFEDGMVLRAKMVAELKTILEPAQLEKMKEIIAERMERMEQRKIRRDEMEAATSEPSDS